MRSAVFVAAVADGGEQVARARRRRRDAVEVGGIKRQIENAGVIFDMGGAAQTDAEDDAGQKSAANRAIGEKLHAAVAAQLRHPDLRTAVDQRVLDLVGNDGDAAVEDRGKMDGRSE